MQTTTGLRRRYGLALAAVLVLLIALPVAAKPTNPHAVANHTVDISLVATTDVHGRVLNWNYLTDSPYDPGRGLSRISTIVNDVRDERGSDHTLLVDVGDMIQGTPLVAYYARQEPVAEGATHPVAAAMDAMGYDAMVVGNHEFNFGLDHLFAFRDQLDFPMLGANVLWSGTTTPAFEPYVIETLNIPGDKPIRVGILGITTPGSAVWDRSNVEGVLDFTDGLETARTYVSEILAKGADVVVAAMHTGMGSGSSYGDLIPYDENFGTAVAEQVPGIDVILPGHSHRNIAEDLVTNTTTGDQVLITQSGSTGQNVSVVDIELQKIRGQWTVIDKSSELRSTATVPDDPTIDALIADQHDTVVDYVNAPIGTSVQALPMAKADYQDVPVMDLINTVQADAVEAGITGTAYDGYPVLSITAPLSRSAVIPEGDVSIRDVAAVYVYENLLRGIVLTGSQVKDYLERSAQYFDQVTGTGPYDPSDITGNGPTYCYDVIGGVSYDIDLSEPAGQRITDLSYGGAPVGPTDEFVVAINNYRHNGGCGYPHVTTAPVAFFGEPDIQDLLIQWIHAAGVLDPVDFASIDWQLVYDGTPIEFTP